MKKEKMEADKKAFKEKKEAERKIKEQIA